MKRRISVLLKVPDTHEKNLQIAFQTHGVRRLETYFHTFWPRIMKRFFADLAVSANAGIRAKFLLEISQIDY